MDPASIAITSTLQQPNHILWVKRKDCGIWVLPGGGIDPGETPEQAALRELLEETGIQGHIVKKAALLTPKNAFSADTHLYLCQAENELPPQSDSTEVAAAGYFPASSPPEPCFPLHEEWIAEIQKKGSYFERTIDEITPLRVLKFFLKHPLATIQYLLSRLF